MQREVHQPSGMKTLGFCASTCTCTALYTTTSSLHQGQAWNTAHLQTILKNPCCVLQVDPEFDQHEKEFKAISREILGEEDESEDEDKKGGCGCCSMMSYQEV